MGSGGWLKKIISSKKERSGKAKSLKEYSSQNSINGFNEATLSQNESTHMVANENFGTVAIPVEDTAAIRIQCAFRTYKARKMLRHLKGTVRLRTSTLGSSASNQSLATLRHLHTWSKIQLEIRARRISMAQEARVRQKKLENQMKLDSKIHELEVEWSGGTETMEEALGKINLREAAAVKRERTMAYAFAHQWRATSNPVLSNYDISKAIWGWSLTERWIAARPWESKALVQSSPSPKKAVSRQSSRKGKNQKSPTMKPMHSVKSISPKGKGIIKAKKLSYEAPEKEQIAS